VPPAFRAAPVRVRVPATSANLGPAFDCAGLALALSDEVVVRVADRGLSVDVAGEGAGAVPRDEQHLVVAALRAAFDRLGGQPRGLEVVCANRIPHARGLGSSAAAIVAAVVAARALVLRGEERLDDGAVLALASQIEGHPDNVAACLHGGATLAWTGDDGARAVRLQPAPELAPVVFVPATTASTQKARGVLPEQVPHADAAANCARAALLPLALTRDIGLLMAATEDRLHQRYRAASQAGTAALVGTLRAEGVPATVSGAGPAVLALTSRVQRDAVASRRPDGWSVLAIDVDSEGAHVLPVSGGGTGPGGSARDDGGRDDGGHDDAGPGRSRTGDVEPAGAASGARDAAGAPGRWGGAR
jgi:homoserine kinase